MTARFRRGAAALLLASLVPLHARAVPEESAIALGLTVPLAPVMAALEARIPQEVRQDRSWHDHDGFQVRYAARRGPLDLQVQGNVLVVRTLVGYWVQARKTVLNKLTVRGSCGVDEPSRGVLLTLTSRFGLRPDWRLAVETTIHPPQFLNPCRMTFAGIDVTGAVARALHEKLWQEAREVIDREAPRLGDLQVPATLAWRRLHRPIPRENGLWLELNPVSVGVTQPVADGRAVQLLLGLTARPSLREGVPAEGLPVPPLPPLRVAPAVVPSLELPARLALPHGDAERVLRSALEGRPLEWAGRMVTPTRVRLTAEGGKLAVEATLSGLVSGTVRLAGAPEYDGETGELFLRDLDYILRTEDVDLQRLDRGLHELVRGVVAQRSRWPLRERIDEWRARVERSLGELVLPPFTLQTRLVEVRPSAVRVTDTATVLDAVLAGEARLGLE